jgi:exopolysaccharide biosynthesis polyprenyl glycosylphosphotransferase
MVSTAAEVQSTREPVSAWRGSAVPAIPVSPYGAADRTPPARPAAWTTLDGTPPVAREVFRVVDMLVMLATLFAASSLIYLYQVGTVRQLLATPVPLKSLMLLGAFIALWQGILGLTGRYESERGGGWRSEAWAVTAACTLSALSALVAALAVPATWAGPGFGVAAVLLFWVTAIPAVLVARAGARTVGWGLRRSARRRQVIIVGSGPRAYAAYRAVEHGHEAGYEVLGFVDTNADMGIPEVRARHLGELKDLERILMHRAVDMVLIALPARSAYSRIEDAIQVCERVGVESRYLADLVNGSLARLSYQQTGPIPAVAMKVVADDGRVLLKRAADVAAAALGLLALLPLMLAIALAIRLTSPGPILFSQIRYGLNRRKFRMYKFRTMVCDAEALQDQLEHLNEAAGPVFKIREDPRITPLGRFLRRTSLDELPQLFNVLRGDMSLVGPRPLPLRDVQHFTQGSLMRRFSVLPGLTGLWQVSGRSDLGFDDWITLDLRYIDQWSLGLDLKILWRTLPAVLKGAGAS